MRKGASNWRPNRPFLRVFSATQPHKAIESSEFMERAMGIETTSEASVRFRNGQQKRYWVNLEDFTVYKIDYSAVGEKTENAWK